MSLSRSGFFSRGWYVRFGAGVLMLALSPLIARGATLQSGNSTLLVNPDSAVMNYSWTVDGVNEYGGSPSGQESFFFSLGNSAPQPLSTLSPTVTYNNAGLLTVSYNDPGEFTALLVDNLIGGNTGSGSAALTELISINNTSSSALTLHIFQYVDYNAAPAGDDYTMSLSNTPPNTAYMTDSLSDQFTVAVDTPDEYQIADDSSIYMQLTGATFQALNNNSVGPMTGDPSFAFEWDPIIGVGGTDQISITESIQNTPVVPLPPAAWAAVWTLAAIAGIGTLRRVRRMRLA
jgi:hypothetical protein